MDARLLCKRYFDCVREDGWKVCLGNGYLWGGGFLVVSWLFEGKGCEGEGNWKGRKGKEEERVRVIGMEEEE